MDNKEPFKIRFATEEDLTPGEKLPVVSSEGAKPVPKSGHPPVVRLAEDDDEEDTVIDLAASFSKKAGILEDSEE